MKMDFMAFSSKLHGLLTNTEKKLSHVCTETLFCSKYQLFADAVLTQPHMTFYTAIEVTWVALASREKVGVDGIIQSSLTKRCANS